MTGTKIGDIVPLEHEVNPNEVRAVNYKRRANRAVLAGEAAPTNMYHRAALKAKGEIDQAQFRQRDPFEQAKTFLRSKGYVPVASLPGVGHQVGKRTFDTQEEVFNFAASLGWGKK